MSFLVSCGTEYGISKGTKVTVLVEGASQSVDGLIMHKVTNEVLIVIIEKTGEKVSIPKEKVRLVIEDK